MGAGANTRGSGYSPFCLGARRGREAGRALGVGHRAPGRTRTSRGRAGLTGRRRFAPLGRVRGGSKAWHGVCTGKASRCWGEEEVGRGVEVIEIVGEDFS